MPMAKLWLRHIGQALLICLVTLFVFEAIGSVLFPTYPFIWPHRYLFISKDGFRAVDNQLWTYKPNGIVESSAVYGFPYPGSRFTVEYHCRFETNEWGLIKGLHPFDASKKTIFVVGDSNVEGLGGCPWTYRLEERFPEYNIINGGLMGTGLDSFWDLYQYLIHSNVKIDHVLIISISSDYYRQRHFADWIRQSGDCLREGRCPKLEDWYGVDLAVTNEELEERARKAARDRHGEWSYQRALRFYFNTRSFTYRLYNLIVNRSRNKPPLTGEIPIQSVDALQHFQSNYPDLAILMIPEKPEVGLGDKGWQRLNVELSLQNCGYRFGSCDMSSGDFLVYDGHPNVGGYKKVAACAARMIEGFK